MKDLSIKKILFLAIGIIGLVFLISYAGSIGEEVEAGEIVVIQKPVSGELLVYTEPGWVWQHFGKATHYKKSFQFWFTKPTEKDGVDNSIKVRFNDGGYANISGSVRVDLPLDKAAVLNLHTKFGSQEAIEHQLVKTVLEKSVYMTGPLMSSAESYAEKRNNLLSYIEDQATQGVYKTITRTIKTVDPISGAEKTTSVVEIVMHNNTPLRQEKSPISETHVKLSGLALNSIDYDATVEKQIAAQQQAVMQVQTAIANAKRAEQDALTAAKQGEASAAKAKWDQEVIKAKVLTEAQQELEKQKLATQQAALYKQQQILEGEGEAAKQRLIMQANGALDQKLEAYKTVQKYWADAFSKYPGAIVPMIQTGGSSTGNGALNFAELMSMKAAKDLALDLKNK